MQELPGTPDCPSPTLLEDDLEVRRPISWNLSVCTDIYCRNGHPCPTIHLRRLQETIMTRYVVLLTTSHVDTDIYCRNGHPRPTIHLRCLQETITTRYVVLLTASCVDTDVYCRNGHPRPTIHLRCLQETITTRFVVLLTASRVDTDVYCRNSHPCLMSRPCPTPVTRPVERSVSLDVFLFYRSNPDLAHHSRSWTCIAHLSSAKSILDP